VEWRRAVRALRELLANPDQTEKAFEVFVALDGDREEQRFQRLLADPHGAALVAQQPSLLACLSDRAALMAMPAESFGRAYLAYLERTRFRPTGLLELQCAVQARWERRNLERADRVIVTSQYSARVVQALYGIPVERLAVVPEPIDLRVWREFFEAAKARPATRPTVLTVARMYPRKHLDDLIIAAARLRTRIAALQVRIVGDGPESLRLRALVARHGLGDTVVFLGQVARSTLAVEYGRAHCFCLPSVQEGFGIVFAEAMAAGLPIVACRAAAVPEVVADGRVGLLVAPRSPDEVATALETLLSDARLRREMGEEGRRRVETFDLVPVARSFLEALPA